MNLPTTYQQYIHLSKYARWREEEQRRETWEETVWRYFDFFAKHFEQTYLRSEMKEFEDEVLNLGVMPSMRCMMTAGRALARDHIAGYNCAYTPINRPQAFDEILFILMCGTGVGFSVERQYISKLPEVAEAFEKSDATIVVRDSKRGWAEALREFIHLMYAGRVPNVDVSRVRAEGTRLKTMGGRASGPRPLLGCFAFIERVFRFAAGRRLTSLECHDLVCKIAECVVVGGVRRSALLSLSNLSDLRMRDAKSGSWWLDNEQRSLANNSACYSERPDVGAFMAEWLALYQSRSGERGIFNRDATIRQAARNGRRNTEEKSGGGPISFGTNPCSEIILRPNQFCNLTEVVCREEDNYDDLARKVTVAATLGTWQATLTDFRYIGREWKRNCEEERLLGVSLTGVMDCVAVRDSQTLISLRDLAIETNRREAERLGISPAAAITCVKPSGTVSQLVNSSSGLHPRYSPFYIRRVRESAASPLTRLMQEIGFPWEQDAMKPNLVVFSFPQRAPEFAKCEMSALDQLRLWRMFQEHWCEHKPSMTVEVGENEWPKVGAWVWKHFDELSGVSFLPRSGHTYVQAPYEAITEAQWEEFEERMPKVVEWERLKEFEGEDMTEGGRELACSAGSCEI